MKATRIMWWTMGGIFALGAMAFVMISIIGIFQSSASFQEPPTRPHPPYVDNGHKRSPRDMASPINAQRLPDDGHSPQTLQDAPTCRHFVFDSSRPLEEQVRKGMYQEGFLEWAREHRKEVIPILVKIIQDTKEFYNMNLEQSKQLGDIGFKLRDKRSKGESLTPEESAQWEEYDKICRLTDDYSWALKYLRWLNATEAANALMDLLLQIKEKAWHRDITNTLQVIATPEHIPRIVEELWNHGIPVGLEEISYQSREAAQAVLDVYEKNDISYNKERMNLMLMDDQKRMAEFRQILYGRDLKRVDGSYYNAEEGEQTNWSNIEGWEKWKWVLDQMVALHPDYKESIVFDLHNVFAQEVAKPEQKELGLSRFEDALILKLVGLGATLTEEEKKYYKSYQERPKTVE